MTIKDEEREWKQAASKGHWYCISNCSCLMFPKNYFIWTEWHKSAPSFIRLNEYFHENVKTHLDVANNIGVSRTVIYEETDGVVGYHELRQKAILVALSYFSRRSNEIKAAGKFLRKTYKKS